MNCTGIYLSSSFPLRSSFLLVAFSLISSFLFPSVSFPLFRSRHLLVHISFPFTSLLFSPFEVHFILSILFLLPFTFPFLFSVSPSLSFPCSFFPSPLLFSMIFPVTPLHFLISLLLSLFLSFSVPLCLSLLSCPFP